MITPHVHQYELTTEEVRLHKADPVRRKLGYISGVDVMKQRVCACGKVETYDLVRKKL